MEDKWVPPADATPVEEWTPPTDATPIDEPLKKKEQALPTFVSPLKSEPTGSPYSPWSKQQEIPQAQKPKGEPTRTSELGGPKIVAPAIENPELVSEKLNQKINEVIAQKKQRQAELGERMAQIETIEDPIERQILQTRIEEDSAEITKLNKTISNATKAKEGLKKPEPIGFIESVINSGANMGTQLQTLVPKLKVASADVWENVLGKELAEKWYKNDWLEPNRDIQKVRDEAYSDLSKLKEEIKPTEGIVDNLQNFNIPGAAAGIINATTSLATTAIPALVSGGSSIAIDVLGQSIVDYNEAKAEELGISVNDLYKSGQADLAVPATVASFSTALEAIGLKGVSKAINTKIKNEGIKGVTNFLFETNKEGVTELIQAGLETANTELAKGKSLEDATASAVDTMFSKQGAEQYAGGFFGATASAAGGSAYKSILGNPVKGKETTIVEELIPTQEEGEKNKAVFEKVQEIKADPDSEVQLTERLEAEMELGEITPEEADTVVNVIEATKKLDAKVPDNIEGDLRLAAINIIAERENLTASMEGKDESLLGPQKSRIKALNQALESISNGESLETVNQIINPKTEQDATKKGNDTESNQQQYSGVAGQEQGQQEDRADQKEPIPQAESETSGSDQFRDGEKEPVKLSIKPTASSKISELFSKEKREERVKSSLEKYNGLSAREKRSQVGQTLLAEVNSGAKDMGYSLKSLNEGRFALMNESGVQIKKEAVKKTEEELQALRDNKRLVNAAKAAEPKSLYHGIAQLVANNVRFNSEELRRLVGDKVYSEIPSLFKDAKGQKLEFLKDKLAELGYGNPDEYGQDYSADEKAEVEEAVRDFFTANGRQAATDYILKQQENEEGQQGMIDSGIVEQSTNVIEEDGGDLQGQGEVAPFQVPAEYPSNLTDISDVIRDIVNNNPGATLEDVRANLHEIAPAFRSDVGFNKSIDEGYKRATKYVEIPKKVLSPIINRIRKGLQNLFGTADSDVVILDNEAELMAEAKRLSEEGQVDFQMEKATEQSNDIELTYNKEGQHLAPNGKPSKLTEQQAKIVRTKAFKDWFGDWENNPKNASKVVDENGEPLVVYHGTQYKFNTFDKNKLGENTRAESAKKGFFVSPNKNIANSYRKAHIIDNPNLDGLKDVLSKLTIAQLKQFGNSVLGYDITAFDDDGDGYYENKKNIEKELFHDIEMDSSGDYEYRQQLIENAAEYLKQNKIEFSPYKEVGMLIEAFVNIRNPHNFDAESEAAQDINLPAIIDDAKNKNKDGVLIDNVYDSISFDVNGNDTEEGSIMVFFEPNQIKLADGSNTTFNPNTDDIRFQSAGGKTIEFMQDPSGKILGFAHNGNIYLNGEHLNANTPIHEAGHIWTAWAEMNAPDLFKAGMAKVDGSPYLAEVKANKFYQEQAKDMSKEQAEDFMKKEALAMAIGDNGEKFVLESKRADFKTWLEELWKTVGKFLGISDLSPSQISRMSLDDFAKRIAADILQGRPQKKESTDTPAKRAKALATELSEAENIPKELRDKIKANGITGEVFSHKEAKSVAEAVIKSEGIEGAVQLANSGVLKGSVKAFVFGNAVDYYSQKIKDATTSEDKEYWADKGAEVAAMFESDSENYGRFISAIGAYYKNHPDIIQKRQLKKIEEANHKLIGTSTNENIKEVLKDFEQLKREFDEKVEETVNATVEEISKNLAPEKKRAADKAISALEKFQSKIRANSYSDATGIIAAVDSGVSIIIKAIKIGKSVSEAIEIGVAHINSKMQGKSWNEDKFRKDMEDGFKKEGITVDEQKKSKQEAILNKYFPKKVTENPKKRKEAHEKIIEQYNAGVFEGGVNKDGKTFESLFYEKLGLVDPNSAEVKAKIAEFSEKLGKAKEGSIMWRETSQDMMNYLANIAYESKMAAVGNRAMAMWYANILSSPATHLKNMQYNIVQALISSPLLLAEKALINRKGKGLSEIAKVYADLFKGLAKGKTEGGRVLSTGRGTRFDAVAAAGITDRSKAMKFFAAPGRTLRAPDILFTDALHEVKMSEIARNIIREQHPSWTESQIEQEKNNMLTGTQERLAEAKEQVEKELEEFYGKDWRNEKDIEQIKKIREFEVMEESLPAEMQQAKEDATRWAKKSLLTNKPTGIYGMVSDGIQSMNDTLYFTKFVMPFVNVPLNIVQSLIEKTPIGLVNAIRGKVGFGKYETELTKDEKQELLLKAINYSVAMAAMIALNGEDDEDDFVITGQMTGDYTDNRGIKRGGGLEPYSVYIKGKKILSYKYTPWVALFLPAGYARDYKLYGKNESASDAVANVALNYMLFNLETSSMKGLSGILESVNKAKDFSVDRMKESLGKLVSGFIPYSSMTKYATNTTNAILGENDKRPIEWYEHAIRDIPFVQGAVRTRVDHFGEPVQEQLDIPLVPIGHRGILDYHSENSPYYKLMNEKGYSPTWMTSKTIFVEGKDKPITKKELDQLNKERGEIVRKALDSKNIFVVDGMDDKEKEMKTMDYLRTLDKPEFKKHMAKLFEKAGEMAKMFKFGELVGIPKKTIEKYIETQKELGEKGKLSEMPQAKSNKEGMESYKKEGEFTIKVSID